MLLKLLFLAAVASHVAPVRSAPPIIVGYYPTYKNEILSKLDLANYTHVNIAFVIPDENAKLAFDGDAIMSELVPKLQGHNTKALVSLGGWTGSVHFSNIVKKPELAEALTNNIIEMMKKYNLDGIDIDWEHPSREGNPCNFVDKDEDTPKFLAYLKSLRKKMDEDEALGKEKLITLAVRLQPFDSASKEDIEEFANVVNFANIMQYDINGAWGETTGPNAPLNFEKGKGTQLSFATGIEEWTKAGWPAAKLTGGLAFYGRSLTANEDMLAANPVSQYQNFSKEIPQGDKTDQRTAERCPPNAAKQLDGEPVFAGTWTYANLREQGVLTEPTKANDSWVRTVDDITATPWLFNKETRTFITYDDAESLKAKVDFAMSKGLGGVMVWEMSGDFNGELSSAIRA